MIDDWPPSIIRCYIFRTVDGNYVTFNSQRKTVSIWIIHCMFTIAYLHLGAGSVHHFSGELRQQKNCEWGEGVKGLTF